MKRIVKGARWSRSPMEEPSLVYVRFGDHSRKLRGEAATWLSTWPEGTITFVTKAPRDYSRHLMIVGVPEGIAVVLYTARYVANNVLLGHVKMCDEWKRRFGVSRKGQVRWAKYKGQGVTP